MTTKRVRLQQAAMLAALWEAVETLRGQGSPVSLLCLRAPALAGYSECGCANCVWARRIDGLLADLRVTP